jgi:tRNA(Ile)-lysidine synthetase-like protein
LAGITSPIWIFLLRKRGHYEKEKDCNRRKIFHAVSLLLPLQLTSCGTIVSVHSLAERVLSHIRRDELLSAGDRVGVAVSGGIDSVALLRVLLELRGELGIVLSVVHFNHRLRGAESDTDQEFVAGLAREFDLEFHVDGEDVAARAAEEHVSIETAARELRYGFFRYLLGAEQNPSGAEALVHRGLDNRSAESAAPPKNQPSDSGPQGLKPAPLLALNGTAEAVPFHETPDGAAESRALSIPDADSSPDSDSTSDLTAASDLALRSNSAQACLSKIVTGHTLDDQAETVLMRMIRGAGLRGLGGIYPRILIQDEDDDGEASGEIVRPLLTTRRRELEQYLKDIGQCWREDSTNGDEHFTRNRVRKLVVPLLEREFNPAVAENLAELAEIARGEEDYWENEVSGWLGTTVQWAQPEWARAPSNSDGLVQIAGIGNAPSESISSKDRAPKDTASEIPTSIPTSRAEDAREMGHPFANAGSNDLRTKIENASWLVMNASVPRMWFLGESVAVQRRLVKAVGENAGIPLEFKHVEEILRVAAGEGASGKEVSLPLGWRLVVEPDELAFVTPDLREPSPQRDYEYELSVPGEVVVREGGFSVSVQRVPSGEQGAYNPDQLLDEESVPGPLRVRNWRPGDRFWPAHTKSPKKIKELLQDRHVAQPERGLWPVIASRDDSSKASGDDSRDEIVWVRGFPSPAKLRARPGRAAILITERRLAEVLRFPLDDRPST